MIEPDSDYILPLGKARIHKEADKDQIESGQSCVIITYGMGVYWAEAAAKSFDGQVEILDLRTLHPLDWDAVANSVRKHSKAMVLTEEPIENSFAESLAGRISRNCFESLDAPVEILGAASLPAIALNVELEKQMLPNAEKVKAVIKQLLNY